MNRKKTIICLFFLTSLFFLIGNLELLDADNQPARLAELAKRVKQSTGLSKAMTHYNLGKEYFLSKKYSKAYREFGLAAQLDRSDRKSVCRLSEMYLKRIEKIEQKRKQIEAKKRLEEMKTESRHQSPDTSYQTPVTSYQSPAKKKQENKKQRIAKEKRQRAEEKIQKLTQQKARVEKIKQEKIKKKAEDRKQKTENRKQKKQQKIEAKKQKIEERRKKKESKKQKTEEIISFNEVEQRIEINLHYRQGREYFQQKKFMEAIVEFELVRSKIDKNHPYFIPCSIYIEQAREALTRE